ncbi:MAG: alkaline phosphatase family protein [Bacillota bacterium]
MASQKIPERAIVIGIDGAMLSLAERFMKDGAMPNLRRLAEKGTYSESLPSIPVDTPTNWTTIATGAEPVTHGILSFTAHRAGEPLDVGEREGLRNKQSTSSKAEFLWAAAEKQGKRTLIINYPTGWPGTDDRRVVLGGLTPGGDLWRVKKPCVYATGYPETVALDLPTTQIKHSAIELRRAEGWSGEIESKLPPLEARIRLGNERNGEDVFVMITASTSDGYDRLAVAPSKDASLLLANLAPGEWSQWLVRNLDGLRVVFRLKLARLSCDAQQVELYCTDVFRAEGWCHPAGLESDIVSQVGPYVEGLESPYVPVNEQLRPYGPLNVGPQVTLELAGFQAEWMARTAKYLQESRGWDILFLHYHLIDTLNHTFLGYLDPGFPYTSESRTSRTWDLYRDAYRIVDKVIGDIAEGVADESTVLVVTSDHAALPCWRYVSIVGALVGADLLEYAWDVEAGRFSVDLGRSRAVPYLDPQHIWVNLEGREPGGIVPPEQYESVREQIIAALRQIRDPETGEHPVQLACRPEDLGIVGPSQDWVGDVLYFLKPGYTTWDGELESLRFASQSPERLSRPIVRPSRDVVGHHTPYLPAARYKEFTNAAMTFFCGPGIRQGYRRRWPIRLKDISPTIAHLLNIRGPAQSEGSIVWDMLEG